MWAWTLSNHSIVLSCSRQDWPAGYLYIPAHCSRVWRQRSSRVHNSRRASYLLGPNKPDGQSGVSYGRTPPPPPLPDGYKKKRCLPAYGSGCQSGCEQGRIKLFGAPRQWKHFRPLFQAVFLSGAGGGCITPQTESNTTPPSSKTEITNILFYILNFASIIKFKI